MYCWRLSGCADTATTEAVWQKTAGDKMARIANCVVSERAILRIIRNRAVLAKSKASCGRNGAWRWRRRVKRRHHELQIECFLADARVVIQQNDGDHRDWSGDRAANSTGRRGCKRQPRREMASDHREHRRYEKGELE